MQTIPVVLNSGLSVKAKSQNICHHSTIKKTCFKKVQKLKKKVLLRVGLNPQLRWLTSVCLRGFNRNVQQMFTVFPLHQCLQRAVMNEQKQLSISNQQIRVPRRRAFNFAVVPFRCVLVMPSNSVIKAEFKKKTCMQKVLICEKKIR